MLFDLEALLLAALHPRADGQVFNLGSREVVSLTRLAHMLVELHPGARFEIVPFPPDRKAIDIGDYYSDYSKVEGVLGWQPKVGLRQGLMASLAYYGKHQQQYWNAT